MSDLADDDVSSDIARLEAEIERLAEALERCRKIALIAKGALTLGGFGFLSVFVGLIRLDLMPLLVSMTAVLGGLVVFGSNDSTRQQTLEALLDAEAERADLIGSIELRLVGDASTAFPRRTLGRGPGPQ